MYADLAFENNALKNFIEKKALRPAEKREAVGYLANQEGLSIRQACRVIQLSLSVFYYQFKVKSADKLIVACLEALAERYPTYGFKKMFHLLRADGIKLEPQARVQSLCDDGFEHQKKTQEKASCSGEDTAHHTHQKQHHLEHGLMHDSLITGRSYRTFNVIDDHNREALMITVDTSLSSRRITRSWTSSSDWRGKPEVIRCDNGPEFTSAVFEAWSRRIRSSSVLSNQENQHRTH